MSDVKTCQECTWQITQADNGDWLDGDGYHKGDDGHEHGPDKGATITVQLSVPNLAEWADEYGCTVAEAPEDVASYVSSLINDTHAGQQGLIVLMTVTAGNNG